jgi:hypothetical protein
MSTGTTSRTRFWTPILKPISMIGRPSRNCPEQIDSLLNGRWSGATGVFQVAEPAEGITCRLSCRATMRRPTGTVMDYLVESIPGGGDDSMTSGWKRMMQRKRM